MDEAGDLGVLEASRLLARRSLSAAELTQACLARIGERDGDHSHDGDPGSVNAWVRVYEEDARAAAAAADERLARGDAPPLCGIPIGLKDLYAVAGKPLTASSRVLDEVAERWTATRGRASRPRGWSCSAISTRTSSRAAGRPTRSATRGRSSVRQVARAAARARRSRRARCRRRPARTPPAPSASRRRSAARRPSSRRAGCSRSVGSCRWRRASTTRGRWPARCVTASRSWLPSRASSRHASVGRSGGTPSPRASPTSTRTSPTASNGRSRRFPGERVEPPPPSARLDVLGEFFDLVLTEMLVYHRRFDDRRDDYRFSNRARLEHAEQRAMTAEEYVAGQVGRAEDTAAWCDWLAEHRIDAVVEPTIPIVAPVRGTRLRRALRRPRRPVADLLLGLDGLPRRLAALRRRTAQRAARERLAHRRSRAPTGTCSRGERRSRRNWVRSRRDRPRIRHRDRRARAHGAHAGRARSDAAGAARGGRTLLRQRPPAAHDRRRRGVLPRAGAGGGRVHRRLGARAAGSRRSRTRRSPRAPPRTPTC